MAIDTKTVVLLDLTAAVQQQASLGTTRLQSFLKGVTDQGLLAETPTCTDQQSAAWSKAASELLTTVLAQMSSAEVDTCQTACCLASASLSSCSASIFMEHYNSMTIRAMDLVRKQALAPALTNPPHVWIVITAAFTRIEQLVHLPGLRREASSLAPKLMAVLQPTLATTGSLPHASSQGLSSHYIELLKGLNAGLQALPTAFRAHQKALGQFAAALLASPMLSSAVRSEAARTFSLLPRLTGDAETWSSFTQNVLCACHSRLQTAYLGMDDSALAASAKAALDPAAQPLTAPSADLNLAQHSMAGQHCRSAGQSVHSVAAVEAALGQLAGFLDALERLLTVSFPVAVPVPAHGILMLLTRILSFDDSVKQAGQVPPSASAYLTLSAALPALHSCALGLLQTLLWTGQGSLLLHYAPMARMLSNLLRQIAAAPALDPAPAAALLRQQVYKTASEVVGRGGMGVGALLGPQAVTCAVLELYGCKQSRKRPMEEGLPNGHPPKKQKKSKKDDELPSFESILDGSGGGSGVAGETAQQQQSSSGLNSSSAGAQEAALQLLQSLLQAWGSSMSQQQRMQIDAIIAHIASTASSAAHHMSQTFEGNCNQAGAVAVQLAALKALLASVLSPAPCRPPFLPQALALFTQGLQSAAPDIAHFSQQALLAVEGIMHPRAGHTILQPQRHATNPHPYLSASAAELIELGMPRLWSALAPGACLPEQKAGTAITVETSQQMQAKAAGMAMAQEMLQAGRLCSAAAAKLQATLDGSGAGDGQPAEHAAEHHPQQQVAEGNDGPAAAAVASREAALAAAAPMGSPHASVGAATTNLDSNGQDVSVAAYNVQKFPSGNHAHEGFGPKSVQQPARDSVTVSGAMLADDGFLSLGHLPVMTGKSDASKELAIDAQIPGTVQGYPAAAESSDSQGSLPEIDSGESSDSSSS